MFAPFANLMANKTKIYSLGIAIHFFKDLHDHAFRAPPVLRDPARSVPRIPGCPATGQRSRRCEWNAWRRCPLFFDLVAGGHLTTGERMPDDPKTDTLSVVEEQVSLSKQAVLTGRVRIATQTETVEHRLPAELSSEEVEVVRVPVDRRIDTIPQMTTEGDLTIIPVVEERLVVTRELYLREEIHVRRIKRQETVEIPAEIRRQTVRIERLSKDGDPIQPNSKDDQDDL